MHVSSAPFFLIFIIISDLCIFLLELNFKELSTTKPSISVKKIVTTTPNHFPSVLLLNQTEQSADFISRNGTSVSVKMGLDIKKKEIFIDAKNWKEIVCASILLIFILIVLTLVLMFLSKNKKYFCRRKPIGWSYRSNYV